MSGGSARSFPCTGCCLALGLGLRLWHYLRNPSLWHDEAALVLNVLGKDFGDLLGPLFFGEAAPPLFLWLERGVALRLGDGTYALRLVPLLASGGALLLLAHTARRVLSPAAVPWAVLLGAGSDQLLWHACEAKPYSTDVLAAVVLLALFPGPADGLSLRRGIAYALLAPLVIFLAYPGCFLYGGLLVALLPRLGRARHGGTWLGYALLALCVFGSAGLLIAGPARAQRCPAMVSCWLGFFAPWERPWSVPVWALHSTLELVRYCFEPIGQSLCLLALLGMLRLGRRGQGGLVLLGAAPVALALLAACFRAYPYGGARVLVFAAPALALSIAEGIPPARHWLRARSRVAAAGLTALLLAPPAWGCYHAVSPWERADCATAAAYVLRQRNPADALLSNHWEYAYYFRHAQPPLRSLDTAAVPRQGRVWLLLTGGTPADRQHLMQALVPEGTALLDRRDFAQTTVFLLGLSQPESSPPAARRAAPADPSGGSCGAQRTAELAP